MKCVWPPSNCSATTSPRGHSNRQVLRGLLPTERLNKRAAWLAACGETWGPPVGLASNARDLLCVDVLRALAVELLLTRPTSSTLLRRRTLSAQDTQPTVWNCHCCPSLAVHETTSYFFSVTQDALEIKSSQKRAKESTPRALTNAVRHKITSCTEGTAPSEPLRAAPKQLLPSSEHPTSRCRSLGSSHFGPSETGEELRCFSDHWHPTSAAKTTRLALC